MHIHKFTQFVSGSNEYPAALHFLIILSFSLCTLLAQRSDINYEVSDISAYQLPRETTHKK